MTKIRPWLPPVIALLWVRDLGLACAEHSQSTPWGAAFDPRSIALAIEELEGSGGGAAERKCKRDHLAVVGGAGGVVAQLLDTAVYNIAQAEHLFITSNEAAINAAGGGSPEAVCPGCWVLWKDKGALAPRSARTGDGSPALTGLIRRTRAGWCRPTLRRMRTSSIRTFNPLDGFRQ